MNERMRARRLELLGAHVKAALVLLGVDDVVTFLQQIVAEHQKLTAREARRAELAADELDEKKFGPRPTQP